MPRIVPFSFEEGPAQTGQDMTLTCNVPDGDLPLKIQWFLNMEPVSMIQGITTSKVGKRTSYMNIESIKGKHAGNYTCMAENKAGQIRYSTELKVYGQSILNQNYLTNSPVFCTIHSFKALPKIAPFTAGADTFYPGDYITLQCSIITGDLPMQFFWEFNNERLEPDLGVSISKIGTRSTALSIDSVKGKHAGNYTCNAKNKAGMANFTTSVVVNGKSISLMKFLRKMLQILV